MPSLCPRSIAFAAVVALLGIVGAWLEPVGAGAWKLACAMLAVGLIVEWVAVSRRRPQVRLARPVALKLGVPASVSLAFANPGRRERKLEYVPALPRGLSGPRESRRVVLPAGGERVDDIEVMATALSAGPWRRLPARIRGPLGLAQWPFRLELGAGIPVRPDSLRRRQRRIPVELHGRESRARIGAGMELHHLRPYRHGDPKSSIDWKAAARSGELITRVMGEDQHLEIVLAIDAGRTSRLEMDGMSVLSHFVNVAARFAEYALLAEDSTGLVVFADRMLRVVPPRRGLAGVRALRAALSGLEPQPMEANLIEAALSVRRLVRHRSLVVLLTSLDQRGARGQLARFVATLLPKHLPLIVGPLSDEVAALAERPARDWLHPYQSLAAQSYRQDLESGSAGLAAMGAIALTARPAELETRVLGQYDRLRARHRI